MISETSDMVISLSRGFILGGKSGRNTPDESRLEVEEKLALYFVADVSTSNRLKTGFVLVQQTLVELPVISRTKHLRGYMASHSISK